MQLESISLLANSPEFAGVKSIEETAPRFGDVLNQTINNQQQSNKSGPGNFINDTISELNEMVMKSVNMEKRFAAGEDINLHDVMIQSQEVGLAMRLTMQLRNKVLEAYREVIRMPV